MSDQKSSSPLKITIKVTHNKLLVPSKPSVEKVLSIDKPEFDRIKSKHDLIKHLAPILSLNVDEIDQLKLFRKSKKHKEYVALETTDDFKSLARSLKVKNHIKLIINDKSSASVSSSNNKKRKIQTMDFSSLGDALLEAAFEHFKELFNDDSSAAAAAAASATTATTGTTTATTGTSTTTSNVATATEDAQSSSNEKTTSEKATADASSSSSSSVKDEKPKLDIDEFVHTSVACDSCSPDTFVPITGVRYACSVCPNFDLCEACETSQHINKSNIGSHSYKHPMTKVAYPDTEFDRRRFGRRGGCPAAAGAGFPGGFPGGRHHFRHSRHGHGHGQFPFTAYQAQAQAQSQSQAAHAQAHAQAHANAHGHAHGHGHARSSPSPPPPPPPPFYSYFPTASQSNDLIYDIPLENCNAETKAKLESFFENEGINSFMKNVQLYVDNAERYEELIRTASLEDNENQLDDELKFTLLKSLLDGGLRPQTSESAPTPPVTSESVTPAPSTSEFSERSTVIVPKEIDTTDKVVISTKKIGNNSRVISLMLTNNTTHIINGGDLKFEFYDSIRNEVVIVKNANSVKPGQTRFYNLGGINKIFDKLSGMNMKITTSNGILEGVYNEFDDSILSFVSVDDSMEVDPKETLLTLTNEDEINVTLIPKSSSLAQIIIHNRSEKTVDCSDLKLEIVNCFGKSVVGVMIRKSHGILPGKIGKFNIGLINAHMKFPFKLIMRNDYNIGHCELSLKNLSGNFNFDPQPVDNQVEQPDLINLEQTPEFDGEDAVMEEDDHSSGTESIIDEKEEIEVVTEETKERETPESEESLLESGSIHSIIVPSLPKESVPLVDSEYLDAKDTVTESKAEEAETPAEEPQHEDDYDIISDGDHEFDSDFEILSPVTSNQ